jgi:ankyrin repeat protein
MQDRGLSSHHAPPSPRSTAHLALDKPDSRGRTPFHRAAAAGCLDNVRAMIRAGAGLNCKDKVGDRQDDFVIIIIIISSSSSSSSSIIIIIIIIINNSSSSSSIIIIIIIIIIIFVITKIASPLSSSVAARLCC